MATLARVFGCTSIIALGGLTAAATMLACGGDEEPSDGESSTSSSSSSSSGGKQNTSSSSSSSSGSAATCDPSGTYEFPPPVWSGEGGICPDFAKNLNTGQDGATYEYKKKPDGTFDEQDATGGAPNPMKIVDDPGGQCALTGAQSLDNINVKDADGNTVKANLRGLTLVVFEGNTATYSSMAELKAVTGEAKGLPCKLAFETTGTKK